MLYIYKISNKINSKIYIGITNNYDKRIREHSYGFGKGLLARSVRKYGWDNFEHELLAITENFNDEKIYIEKYKSNNLEFGYNLTEGGDGTRGFKHNVEARNKMRDAKLGKKLTSEHKRKIGISQHGKKRKQETCDKISEKLKGNKNFLGKTFSADTLKILSDKKAKIWQITRPDGQIITVHNMRKFCLENNLAPSAISRVISGKVKQHKGWTKA